MVTDRGKRSKASGSTEENTDHTDKALSLSMERLHEVQEELEKVNEEASEKVLEVEQKFNEVRRPVYEKRNEIIKTIPDFWLTAFMSHPALGELLNPQDQQIFKYIESLDVGDFKDVKSGYAIAFNFKPNPFFEDTKLVKSFTFVDEGVKIVGTRMKWKEGMGPENGANSEEKGNKRPPVDDSFFTWFAEIQPHAVAGFTDEVADIIKEDLWPNPLKYFSTEPEDEDSDEDEDDDEGDEEDDVDEVDDDDA